MAKKTVIKKQPQVSIVSSKTCIKYDVYEANNAIKSKGFDTDIEAVNIEGNLVTLRDKIFGEYNAPIKSLYPSSALPMHRMRRHLNSENSIKEKFLNREINGLKILEIFYGADRGYKGRNFYFSLKGSCGHNFTATQVYVLKNKKTLKCAKCSVAVKHGERRKVDGKVMKRSPTYLSWLKHRYNLPEKYQDFQEFKKVAGEKPHLRADIEVVGDKLIWVSSVVTSDKDVQLIVTSVRQAFRQSEVYKDCINAARVETSDGVRFQCNKCKELFARKEIQVDHVEPINRLDGTPILKDEILARIWDAEIQILDKKCHAEKSNVENAVRKEAKDLMNGKTKKDNAETKAKKKVKNKTLPTFDKCEVMSEEEFQDTKAIDADIEAMDIWTKDKFKLQEERNATKSSTMTLDMFL